MQVVELLWVTDNLQNTKEVSNMRLQCTHYLNDRSWSVIIPQYSDDCDIEVASQSYRLTSSLYLLLSSCISITYLSKQPIVTYYSGEVISLYMR